MALVVLLYDDDSWREILGSELMKISAGQYEIIGFADRQEFLKRYSGKTPDVVVTDIRGYTFTGIDFIRLYRKNLFTQNIPIIVCSFYSNEDIFNELKQLGISCFLPADHFNIIEILNEAITKILHSNSSSNNISGTATKISEKIKDKRIPNQKGGGSGNP